MDLIDSIVELRSTRSFKQKEIPRDVLKNILEAGRHTPTAHNIQPWHFIVVSDRETKEKIAKGTATFIDFQMSFVPLSFPKAVKIELFQSPSIGSLK